MIVYFGLIGDSASFENDVFAPLRRTLLHFSPTAFASELCSHQSRFNAGRNGILRTPRPIDFGSDFSMKGDTIG